MVRLQRLCALLLLVTPVIAGWPGGALGWRQSRTPSGLPMSWEGSCVYWTLTEQDVINTDFEDPAEPVIPFATVLAAARAALGAWAEVECSYIEAIETEPGHVMDVGHHPGAANANRIQFIEEGWIDPDATWRSTSVVALTSVFYDVQTGAILDADMEFNAEYFEFTTQLDDVAYDIQNAMTHEAGHIFGLAHSDVDDATMILDTNFGEYYMRTLHEDDIEGLCALYPLADDPESCDGPTGGLDVDGESAEWCSDPVLGVSGECVFDETVCCCDGAGGQGQCSWTNARSCQRDGRHGLLELDDEVACGPVPGMHCCCWESIHRFSCEWLDDGDSCSDRGGIAPEHSGACDPPYRTACCCQVTGSDVNCEWADEFECADELGGVPSYLVTSELLCGEFPTSGRTQCQCSAATPARGGGSGPGLLPLLRTFW